MATKQAKRIVCVEDDYLKSLRYWIEDADPFCRSELQLNDYSTTMVVATSKMFIILPLRIEIVKLSAYRTF